MIDYTWEMAQKENQKFAFQDEKSVYNLNSTQGGMTMTPTVPSVGVKMGVNQRNWWQKANDFVGDFADTAWAIGETAFWQAPKTFWTVVKGAAEAKDEERLESENFWVDTAYDALDAISLLGDPGKAVKRAWSIIPNIEIKNKISKSIDDWAKQKVVPYADQVLKTLDERQYEILEPVFDNDPGLTNWREYMYTVGMGGISVAESIALLVATKSPTISAAVLSTMEASDVYLEARKAGKTPEQAYAISSASGLGTFALEWIGLEYLFGISKGGYLTHTWITKNWATRALTTSLFETGQEELQTVWQNVVQKYTYNQAKKISEGWWETAVSISIPTFISGILMPGISLEVPEEIEMKGEIKEVITPTEAIQESEQTYIQRFQKETVAQLGQYSPEAGEVIEGLDLSEVDSLEEAHNLMKRTLNEANTDLMKTRGVESTLDNQMKTTQNIIGEIEGKTTAVTDNKMLEQIRMDFENETETTIPAGKKLYRRKGGLEGAINFAERGVSTDPFENPWGPGRHYSTDMKSLSEYGFGERWNSFSTPEDVNLYNMKGARGDLYGDPIFKEALKKGANMEQILKSKGYDGAAYYDSTGRAVWVYLNSDVKTNRVVVPPVKEITETTNTEKVMKQNDTKVKQALEARKKEVIMDISEKTGVDKTTAKQAFEQMVKVTEKAHETFINENIRQQTTGTQVTKGEAGTEVTQTINQQYADVARTIQQYLPGQKISIESIAEGNLPNVLRVVLDKAPAINMVKDLIEALKRNNDVIDVLGIPGTKTIPWQAKGISVRFKVGKPSATALPIAKFIKQQSTTIAGITPPIKPPTAFERQVVGQPKPRMITRPETALLRERLLAEKRGGKKGYQAGKKEARKNILENLRKSQQNIKEVKKQVIDYAKKHLPISERGRLLNLVEKAKTQEDLAKAFSRINRISEEFDKKTLRNEIIKKFKRFVASANIAIDYKGRIESLLETVELHGHTQKTLSRLKATREWMEEKMRSIQKDLFPLKMTTVFGGKKTLTGRKGLYENIRLSDELRGNVADYSEHIWQSPIRTTAGQTHFGGGRINTKTGEIITSENYFAHTRIEDMAEKARYKQYTEEELKEIEKKNPNDIRLLYRGQKGKVKYTYGEGVSGVRRVIELQSDLYQKGALDKELLNLKPGTGKKYLNQVSDFSKLQQFRNTWQERIIKEEVKLAIKNNKTKLQFPTGETAMKIEGLGEGGQIWSTPESWEKYVDSGDENVLVQPKTDQLKVGQKIARISVGDEDFWLITDVLGDGKFKAVTIDIATQYGAYNEVKGKLDMPKKVPENMKETFDISGKIDTSNPIYTFYEKEVGEFLTKNYNAKKITNEQRITWWEIPLEEIKIEDLETKSVETEIPERVIDAIAILGRKPFDQISLRELENLNNEIDMLAKLGKTKWNSLQELYRYEREEIKKELIAGTQSIETIPEIKAGIGERLSFTDSLRNSIRGILNKIQRIDLVITPMDVIFDILDGSPGTYNGPNSALVKGTVDRDFGTYLEKKDALEKPIIELAKRLELKDENFEKIGFYAVKVQKNGVKKLEALGYTPEQINNLTLDERETKLYNAMRKSLDEQFPAIEKIMREIYNQPIGKVENYFSFVTDWQAMDEAEVYQRIGPVAEELGMPTKKTEMGFTKTRVDKKGAQKIKLNALEIFTRHMDNVAYMESMARDVKMLFEIINSPQYKDVAGDRGQFLALEWIDLIARKGGKLGHNQVRILDILRKHTGAAILGFKLSSAAVQPTALLDGASYIGTWAFRGANNIALHKEWRSLVAQFPEIKKRIADDPAFREFGNKGIEKVERAGFYPLQALDLLTATSIAAGAYQQKLYQTGKKVDFNNIDQEAMEYAESVLRRTQASGFFKDVPLAISRGELTGNRSVDRAFFQFQNFLLNRWSIVRHDVIRVGLKGDIAQKVISVNKIFWLLTANLAASGIRRSINSIIAFLAGSDDDEDNRTAKYMIWELIGMVPFLGQITSMVVYGSEPVPLLEAPVSTGKSFYYLFTGKKPETRWRNFIGVLGGLGKILGIPGSLQLEQFVKKLIKTKTSGVNVKVPSVKVNVPSVKVKIPSVNVGI